MRAINVNLKIKYEIVSWYLAKTIKLILEKLPENILENYLDNSNMLSLRTQNEIFPEVELNNCTFENKEKYYI